MDITFVIANMMIECKLKLLKIFVKFKNPKASGRQDAPKGKTTYM